MLGRLSIKIISYHVPKVRHCQIQQNIAASLDKFVYLESTRLDLAYVIMFYLNSCRNQKKIIGLLR